MAAFVLCGGRWPRWLSLLGCILLSFAALAADPLPQSTVGEPVTVHVDQAKVLKLPERTATLVVGNPLIADVSVQPGGVVVVTAKSYGTTNLVALDRNGQTLMEHPIQVLGPNDNLVVVYRGVERESYSCMPVCERRITLGDAPNYFTANLSQSDTLNSLAQGNQKK